METTLTKKEKLLKALKTTIHALKNDTIFYNWTKPSSCNCGLVVQAITGMGSECLRQFIQVDWKTQD